MVCYVMFYWTVHAMTKSYYKKKCECHDMWAVSEQGKDSNSGLGNSKKAYHATKAASQHLY